jgi:hypothetical protein
MIKEIKKFIFKPLHLILPLVFVTLRGAVAGDLFPPLNTLKPPVKVPEHSLLSVSKDGHFLLDGKPRYLPGVLFYEGVAQTIRRPTQGYPPELSWLYATTLDYEGHQRIGFDATGTFTSNAWIDRYRPDRKGGAVFRGDGGELTRRIVDSTLPLYLDYTCAPWHHGSLTYQEGREPSRDAFSVPGPNRTHWLPYSVTSPEGRRLYTEMWQFGARSVLAMGGRPFVYELFNEPDHNDWSEYNRRLFSENLKKRYRNIEALNAQWRTEYRNFEQIGQFKRQTENPALCVEWIKFMEETFTELCRIGVAAIREIDPRPEAGFCVQPVSLLNTHINVHELNRHMNMVCSSTGGGNAFQARFLHSIAAGKPIFDGEAYVGRTRAEVRNRLWTQYARGFNASFVFKWDRRTYDPLWGKERGAEGGQALAERFRYLLLNPYGVPADALAGIMDMKKEIQTLDNLFTPRTRGVKAEIGLLFSYPAERLAVATGCAAHNQVGHYAAALGYAPFLYDVVLEEQLPAGRAEQYKVLIAAGLNTSYPQTPDHLAEFVRNGGTLLLVHEAMQLDEYGFPRSGGVFGITPDLELFGEPADLRIGKEKLVASPYTKLRYDASWRVVRQFDAGAPAVLEKKSGKGRVLFLNVKMPLEGISALLRELLSPLAPLCRLTDHRTGAAASRIEVHKAMRGTTAGYALFNRGLTPRLVRFAPAETELTFARPLDGTLPEKNEGEYLLLLQPEERMILVGDTPENLRRQFGLLQELSHADSEKEGKAITAQAEAEIRQAAKAFRVNPENVKMLDLRSVVNKAFVDHVAGDGKGGWTDQGEKCLRDVPWGVTECNGVPFDLIRPDQNDGRACLVLGSPLLPGNPGEATGIRVDSAARNLYFLHACAWFGRDVFRYVVHYADGSSAEIPVRNGIETADWYDMSRKFPGPSPVCGWKNLEGRGLWLHRWKNPYPEKQIATLDIVSCRTQSVGIVAAITAELPSDESELEFTAENCTTHSWGQAEGTLKPGILELNAAGKARNWSGCNWVWKKPLALPDNAKSGSLLFEINGGNDAWGKPQGAQQLQLKLLALDSAGKQLRIPYLPISVRIDSEPGTWQSVAIPLRRLLPPETAKLNGISLQFQIQPVEQSGVAIRNLRIGNDSEKNIMTRNVP